MPENGRSRSKSCLRHSIILIIVSTARDKCVIVSHIIYQELPVTPNPSKEYVMSFTITNPFTGLPLEKTPDGTSLKGVTFESKEAALKFFSEHGGNPVEVVEVPVK